MSGLYGRKGGRRPMRGVRTGACILALLAAVFAASAAGAAPVPKKATGVWSAGDCSGGDDIYFVNSAAALVFSGPAVAVAEASWAGGALIVKLAKKKRVLLLDDLVRCPAPPPLFRTAFPEAAALFRAFDRVRPHCAKPGSASCGAAVFQELDVADDGRLSQAELGRALRAAGFFVGYSLAVANRNKGKKQASQKSTRPAPVFVRTEELIAAPGLAVLLGSFVTESLIRSYDFDGDGFLSIKELMQDRVSDDMTALAGVLGTTLTDTAMETVLGSVPGLMRGLVSLLR